MADAARIRQNPETPTRQLDDFMHVLNPTDGTLHVFNGVGARIWDLLAEPTTAEAVVAALGDEYEVDEAQLRTDVTAFIAELHEKGLVVDA